MRGFSISLGAERGCAGFRDPTAGSRLNILLLSFEIVVQKLGLDEKRNILKNFSF